MKSFQSHACDRRPGRTCRASALARQRRPGAGISDPQHHHDRAVRGRRPDRRHRAHRRRRHVEDARPAASSSKTSSAPAAPPRPTRAARAANDGYTLITGHMGTHAASVPLYPKLAYHPEKDFEPVALLAGTPILILAKKDFAAEGPQGIRRLCEGQRRQAEHGACRRRLGVAIRPASCSTRCSASSRPACRSTAPARR